MGIPNARAALIVVVAATCAMVGCGDSKSTKTTESPGGSSGGGQQAAQQDAAAKANARNLVSGVESCFVENQSYAGCNNPAGVNVPIGSGPGQVEVMAAGGSTYTIVAHAQSGTNFKIDKGAGGRPTRSCDKPGHAGCMPGGRW